MKKIFCTVLVLLLICVLSVSLFACANNSHLSNNINEGNESENLIEPNKNTHSKNIDTEELFDYYFTISTKFSYSSSYNFGTTSSTSKYGTKSSSTIIVTPKITGFVDYSGYIELKPETENENKSDKVLKNRRIDIEYWGTANDIYEVINDTQQNDTTISFSDINYKLYAVDIVITYHHDGLSGIPSLNYETISITKYNYKSYLNINIENLSYYTDDYNSYGASAYVYHYYQKYTITPSSYIKGWVEFNNIELTFDNGTVILLDACGNATYKSDEYSAERAIPKLLDVIGCIDFYPPAFYEY